MNFGDTCRFAIELDRYGFKPTENMLLWNGEDHDEWIMVEVKGNDQVELVLNKYNMKIVRTCSWYEVRFYLEEAGLTTPEAADSINAHIDEILNQMYENKSPAQVAEAIWRDFHHDPRDHYAAYIYFTSERMYETVPMPTGREGRFLTRTWENVLLRMHEEQDYEMDMDI